MTGRTAFRRPSRRTLLAAAIVTAVGAPALASAGALAASTGPSGSSAAPAARCVGHALPTLGGSYGDAIAAATNGDITGIASNDSGASQAVVWHAGKVRQIPTGLADSVPAGINSNGDVVGNAPNGQNTVGWVWSGNRTVRLRGMSALTALPAAITNGGVIVGALETTEGTPNEGDGQPGTAENERAAVWRSSASAPQILAPLPGDQGAHAYAIGSDGRIGGVSEGTVFRPVVWDQAGKPHELPGLGGGYGIVRAFGPGGIAVGDVVAKDGTDHAVMWNAAGRITDLGLPQGSRIAQATGVLPGGTVVGTAQMPAPGGGVETQAVQWPTAGHPQPVTAQQPTAVTDAAPQAAVGYRADAKGGRHPMMWRCGA